MVRSVSATWTLKGMPGRCLTALAEARRTKLKDRRGLKTEVTGAWKPGTR